MTWFRRLLDRLLFRPDHEEAIAHIAARASAAYLCEWCRTEGVGQIVDFERNKAIRGEIPNLRPFDEMILELDERYHRPDSMPHPYEYEPTKNVTQNRRC